MIIGTMLEFPIILLEILEIYWEIEMYWKYAGIYGKIENDVNGKCRITYDGSGYNPRINLT